MTRLEKSGIWAAIFGTIVAALSLLLTYCTTPSPNPGPSVNTIKIKDAAYASRWHPDIRHSIYDHLHDACENRISCNYHCDNAHAKDGDPRKGDPKQCVINYYCSKTPQNIMNKLVSENERDTYSISCPKI